MNAHQRRTLARKLKRYDVTAVHHPGHHPLYAWSAIVKGQRVATNAHAWRPGFFSSKATAIRHGIAEAKRNAREPR